MKISYNWLRQYVEHSLTPDQLSDALTMSGLEVEEVETVGSSFAGIVVGHVLEVQRHPDADRLSVCQVDLGNGAPVQIVCGAPNVAAGQKVPVATVGTTLHLPGRKDPSVREAVTLERRPIRGQESNGMICAEDELGLSPDHSGIMVLASDARVGIPFSSYLAEQGREIGDAVLDVNITPNRPDATSHIGIARDVAAVTGTAVRLPAVSLPEAGLEAASQVRVEIQAADGCHRYAAMIVRGVKIGESPEWLKQRLTAVGLRPRNNVVDVTNFVMYECGQPLHAFDYDRIAGRRIVVRHARRDEPFSTLDSKERLLPEGTVLICDDERPVAVAGVMGGENSEVTDATTNVLIESAYFDPSSIRRASRALQLQTDSSYRFERGIDPEGQVWAAARAAALMIELGGGECVPGVLDVHPRPNVRRTVALRLSRLAAVVGTPIPGEEAARILRALGFTVTVPTPDTLSCTVPPFRPDVEREIDLIEEVVRIFGIDNIPLPARTPIPSTPPRELPADTFRRKTRALLAGLGFRETFTNSLLRRDVATLFTDSVLPGEGPVVETLNPISQEMSCLRPSLLPGLLQVVAFNRNHGRRVLRFMEFGHVFRRSGAVGTLVPGYEEHEALLFLLAGIDSEAAWDRGERAVDFFDVKGCLEQVFEAMHLDAITFRPEADASAVATYHLDVLLGNRKVGVVGRLADAVGASFDLRDAVFFAELDWQAIVETASKEPVQAYAAVSRFPVVERDLAVVAPRTVPVGDLVQTIERAAKPLLQHVTVFDLYKGKGIAETQQSIAFSLRLGTDRTLQDAEVETVVGRVVKALQQKHGASLRQS